MVMKCIEKRFRMAMLPVGSNIICVEVRTMALGKREAMRQCLSELGPKASLDDIRTWLRQHKIKLGKYLSQIRTTIKKEMESGKVASNGSRPKARSVASKSAPSD